MITTILFDIDGTLLPMDYKIFEREYFNALVEYAKPYGARADELTKWIWTGTKAMMANDGSASNAEVFWNVFNSLASKDFKMTQNDFNNFYTTDFHNIKNHTQPTAHSARLIAACKNNNLTIAAATNPVFPKVAQHARLNWAGLDPDDFALVTDYENSNYCKPSPGYYYDILKILGKRPEECVMVGNDENDDAPAQALGIKFYLVDDCIIESQENMPRHWRGSLAELCSIAEKNAW